MIAFYFVAVIFLVEFSLAAGDATSPAQARPPVITASTNHTPHSYISDYRGLPTWFSPDEVATRTWKTKDGQTIRLLSREVVKVGLPDLREMVVIRYGDADSNRTVCVDFYATRQAIVAESYLLLCHDTQCPPLKTKVAFEQQGDRKFFNISGESSDGGTLKRTHHRYSYELNNQWQMVEGFSHFEWEVH
jgi:hypothetical protein